MVVVPEFMYRYKNSLIYYEILASDTVRTITKEKKKAVVDEESLRLQAEANERARSKRAMKKEKLSDIE